MSRSGSKQTDRDDAHRCRYPSAASARQYRPKRTSPFAFTGNKFEFRACGSDQSCAGFNTVLNTIIAESIDLVADRLEKLDRSDKNAFSTGLTSVVAEIIRKHRRIIFNGNNYSPEWVEEAERRGLQNVRKSIEALRAYTKPENEDLFNRYHIFSKAEIESRFGVFSNDYHSVFESRGVARNRTHDGLTGRCQVIRESLKRSVRRVAGPHGTGRRVDRRRVWRPARPTHRGLRRTRKALGGEHEGIIGNLRQIREIVDRRGYRRRYFGRYRNTGKCSSLQLNGRNDITHEFFTFRRR